ncbi:hypothetical protein [Maribacter arenosus]|uniref:Uncharacterized protein n=1 Tax=Maribacter arenosus TaxID=1854708 RepID=A0ABR7V6U0_9FLAO|nr:hypothetical protein [Maribacter arenosus]MBD0849415.1 hypothetical protein [Maribacter arenosus]
MGSFWKRKFIWDIAMAVLVIFLPFLIYLHLFFDDNTNSFVILGYEFHHDFQSNIVYTWLLLNKLIPISLLMLWFLNNYFWWRFFIFVPLALWIDTFVGLSLELRNVIVENRFLYSVLGMLVIFPLLIFIQGYLEKYNLSNRLNASFRNWSTSEYKNLFRQFSNKTSSFIDYNKVIPIEEKLRSFYFINLTIKGKFERYFITKKKGIQVRKFDFLIIFVLVLIPFIYYSAWFFPENTKKFELFWFTIDSYGFHDVSLFIWFVGSKICILIPTIIWFITSHNWWRFAILSPIILTVYQLWEAVQSTRIDEIWFSQALPLIIIIIAFLLLISKTINYQSKILDIYNTIEGEIEQLLQKVGKDSETKRNKQVLEYLKKKDNKEEKGKEKIAALFKIREELLTQLKTKN